MNSSTKIKSVNKLNNEFEIETFKTIDQKNDCEDKDKILTLQDKHKHSRKYKKKKDLGNTILRRLAEGTESCGSLAKRLGVKKQLVCYWRDRGISLGIIIPNGGIRPAFYSRGPRYYLLDSLGWQSRNFGPVECRVHAARGDYFRYHIDTFGELNQIPIREEDGSINYVKMFPYLSHQIPPNRYPAIHLGIPSILTNEGGNQITLKIGSVDGLDTLFISPPPVFQSINEFESIRNPFQIALDNVVYFLEHNGKWVLDEVLSDLEFHYAFRWKDIQLYCPDLLKNLPHLKKGTDPSEIVLFWDESLGKGIKDYETTSRQIASDVFAILEVNRKQIIGKRKAKYRKAKRIATEHLNLRKYPLAVAIERVLSDKKG